MRRCTKPRSGGKKTGANPTDRAKSGTKRHHLTDGAGIPFAVALTAANRPDKDAIGELLDARVVRAPAAVEQHLCLDKGYDYADAERAVRRRRYLPHIRRRGEEPRACRRGWEKKPQNYLALVHFAAAIIVFVTIRSELAVALNPARADAGIDIPFPQRDVHVRSLPEPPRAEVPHAEPPPRDAGRAPGSDASPRKRYDQ